MNFDKTISSISNFFKLMLLIAPTALIMCTFLYHETIFKSVSDYMKPDVIEVLKEETRSAVEEALKDDVFVVKLDAAQMIQIQGWIVEGDIKSAEGLTVIAKIAVKREFYDYMVKTYKIHNWETGKYIRKQTGVLTDEGWIMLESTEE